MAKEIQQNVPVVFPVPSYRNLEMEGRLTAMASHLGGTHLAGRDVACRGLCTLGIPNNRMPCVSLKRLVSTPSDLLEDTLLDREDTAAS